MIIDQTADPEELRMALEARRIYSGKQFSDNLHRITEQCMVLSARERPSVGELLGHPVFKQVRHTSLKEQLSVFGIQAVDFRNIKDGGGSDEVGGELEEAMEGLDVGPVEWDF